MIIEIDVLGGKKEVEIGRFAALDGWEIQHKYKQFAINADKAFRRAFTMEVLSVCFVIVNGNKIPLITDAVIDNHLESWPNIKTVFDATLRENGIDPETHADNPSYWAEVGNTMAIAFLAACNNLIEPALKHTAEVMAANKE
jgi:hypothetical protein